MMIIYNLHFTCRGEGRYLSLLINPRRGEGRYISLLINPRRGEGRYLSLLINPAPRVATSLS